MQSSAITNITDFENFWPPNSIQYSSAEWHTSCPWCALAGNGGDVQLYNGVPFTGDDRLVFRLRDNSFFCRVCQRNGLGHNGNYFPREAAELFGISIDEDSLQPVIQVDAEKPLDLWPLSKVIRARSQVQRDYWYNFGWTDDVIRHFMLGYAVLYKDDGPVHLIPMNVRTADAPAYEDSFAMEGRRQGVPTKRTSGAIRRYFWHITGVDDRKIYLTEGGKDAITAWFLKLGDVQCYFGTSQVSKEKIQFLKDYGYEEVVACGDNDDAGRDFNRKIVAWAREVGLKDSALLWAEDIPDKFDLTDLLQTRGFDAAQEYVTSHQTILEISADEVGVDKARYVTSFKEEVDATYQPHSPDEALTLEEIRRDGPRSLVYAVDQFIKQYPTKYKRGKGLIKLLKAPPGAGKTHTLIRLAEQVAEDSYGRSVVRLAKLNQDLDAVKEQIATGDYEDAEELTALERTLAGLQRNIDEFSYASVLWSTPFKSGYDDIVAAGATSNLWVNFDARDDTNCQNFALTQVLGNNHHDIGAFCKAHCPFSERCKREGYLAQHNDRRSHPITVVRHQHLIGELSKDYPDLVIIDESPFHAVENPILVTPGMIQAHNATWEMEVSYSHEVDAIELFTEACRRAISSNAGAPQRLSTGDANPQHTISGAAFFRLLDDHIQSVTDAKQSLNSALNAIQKQTLEQVYQPPHRENSAANVLPRVVPDLYEAVRKELADFVRDRNNQLPSAVHLVAGTLEIYPMRKIQIRARTPIIIADATAMIPELYEPVFERDLDEIYAPDIRNPNAKIEVVYGSDWTISEIDRSLGKEIKDRERALPTHVETLLGESLDLSETPYAPDDFGKNKLFTEYMDIIRTLLEKHTTLLVVVPKRVRGLLEDYVKHNYPDWSERQKFNHFGNLRGTNRYKDMEAIALIGQYRIPYNVLWRRIQAWGRLLEFDEPIPYQMVFKGKPYHGRDDGHSYRTFSHEFAQRFVDFVEEGEMIQAAERIRPHATGENKYVYVFASRPAVTWVTETVKKSQFFKTSRQDSPINKIKAFLIERFKAGEPTPTRDEVCSLFSCRLATFTEAKAAVEVEIKQKLPRGKKGQL